MDKKTESRITRITEEMYHPENFLFITSWNPTWCALCDLYFGESESFDSFEELIYHLDVIHMPFERENAILAEEGVLQVLFTHKRAYEQRHGRFSN